MLTVFQFENQEVRFVGTAEDPWWVAADVCRILELDNVSRALERLDDDEKRLLTAEDATLNSNQGSLTYNLERNQSVWLINESGLYSLVLTSRKPQAKRFKKWVTSEVLPAIRKNGRYEIEQQPEATAITPITSPTLVSVKEIAELFDATLSGVNPSLAAQIKLRSVATYHPRLADIAELAIEILRESDDIEQEDMLTPADLAQKLNESTGYNCWTAKKVNALLVGEGFQAKNPNGDNPRYLPTQKGKRYGKVIVIVSDGKATLQALRWSESILNALDIN